MKREATEIFADAKFELHKWHSNERKLETSCEDYEPSFAKEQLENESAKTECKLLGVGWDKVDDPCMCASLLCQPMRQSVVS